MIDIDNWIVLYENNEAAFIIFALGVLLSGIGYFIKKLIERRDHPVNSPTHNTSRNNFIQMGGSSNTIVTGNNNNLQFGISLQEFIAELKREEARIRNELEHKYGETRRILEIELLETQKKLQDEKASYEELITSLKERIVQLEKLRGQLPDDLLNEAITALKQNKRKKADTLFKQIEENNDDTVKLVAEAAYQRGKIAVDTIQYFDALKHFEKAIHLSPNNTLYLNDAGYISYLLGSYKKALDYYEQALTSDLQTYGEDHPVVARVLNNMGLVWYSLNKYQKAIECFERALASHLRTYDPDHPDVARIKNNLGGVWDSLGEHQKAIDYYEQALASDLKTYGEDHHDVARDQNNLGMAWNSLGNYQKAIDYYEQALTRVYSEIQRLFIHCQEKFRHEMN